MIVLGPNRQVRMAFAFQEGDEFILSPFPEARNGKRPMMRFDTKEELETFAALRRHGVTWLS